MMEMGLRREPTSLHHDTRHLTSLTSFSNNEARLWREQHPYGPCLHVVDCCLLFLQCQVWQSGFIFDALAPSCGGAWCIVFDEMFSSRPLRSRQNQTNNQLYVLLCFSFCWRRRREDSQDECFFVDVLAPLFCGGRAMLEIQSTIVVSSMAEV